MTFVDELFLFPTIFFTMGLGLCALYWLMVIVGAIGIDAIDLDGLFEGADGALDGAIDGAMDGAIDGAVDGAADGAADGVADGAADAGGGSHSLMWYVAQALSLQKAPATVALSLFFLWCWTVSMLSNHYVAPGLPLPPVATSLLVLAASLALGTSMANLSVRPLGKVFEVKSAESRADSIGRTCEVRTGRVTETFGQALASDGGAGLLVEVRCETPNTLAKGSKALIIHFDPEAECYWVEPMESVLAEDVDVPMFARDTPEEVASEQEPAEHEEEQDVEATVEEVELA